MSADTNYLVKAACILIRLQSISAVMWSSW